jgi:hypothetical protein
LKRWGRGKVFGVAVMPVKYLKILPKSKKTMVKNGKDSENQWKRND